MHQERGIALLIALILAVLLSIIGLSLTFSSIHQLGITWEFENHEKALLAADAGLVQARALLRGRNINQLLAQETAVPRFPGYRTPVGNFALRNPITMIEARNTDFVNYTGSSTASVRGFLTTGPTNGILIGNGPGRFFAKVSDNQDEAPGPDDPTRDMDGVVMLRVLGVYPTPAERATYNSSVKNSVAVVEAMLRRDLSLAIESPVVLYGSSVLDFNPQTNKILIDGYDHTGMDRKDIVKNHDEPTEAAKKKSGIGLIYDNMAGGDALALETAMRNQMKDKKGEYITGAGGTPSINDDTQEVRTSPNPDAPNIFSPYFMNWFLAMVLSEADTITDGIDDTAKEVDLGSLSSPKIVVCTGDLKVTGNVTGAGLLVVNGKFDVKGTINYDGLILVTGKGQVDIGGTINLIGGLYVANINKAANGVVTYGTPSFNIQGTPNIYNHSGNIMMAINALPLRVVGWREVTPEIEPSN